MSRFDQEGLTFDDVLLVVKRSDTLPNDTDISSKLTRNISLKIPFVSAAMDTVTEWKMAVAMARTGGIGILHKNCSTEQQVSYVKRVKKFLNGFIEKPVFFYSDQTVEQLINEKDEKEFNFSSFPIVERESGELCGIFTSHDMKFVSDRSLLLKDVMTKDIVKGDVDTGFEKAYQIMIDKKVSKLPIVDSSNHITGLFCLSDLKGILSHGFSVMTTDNRHQLRCGAAISPYDYERVEKLVEAGVDVVVLDTAHGHSKGVIETLKSLKESYGGLQVIAGNIATADAALELYEAGADGLKVGIGPGSICTTRVVAGVGVPQITAIYECARIVDNRIPVIADGGIRYSGDVAKAIAAGASSVMMGSTLAGTDESPGEKILLNGRRYVLYRGMGSLAAMKEGEGSRKRYFQEDVSSRKLVPEGIEGMVPYSGSLNEVMHQFCGGLRSSLGYTGSKDLDTLKTKASFIKVSPASLREGHPHDVKITKEAPNYNIGGQV
ncbi:MAG: IMP dehydrogenase [Candidatus Muiribacterium halophilum]|uniref:Inosine-5'-monophosphate dehydrogenase n=1 Tax=Muiribacterium halophilum TaxID=2053465 RepID=A0A2N5ZLM5_MUIH1|nr:MAG: IMP dehydrogenase [Candidatus Muirbacterium halophilum]